MKKIKTVFVFLLAGLFFFTACQSKKNGEPEARTKEERLSYFPYQTMIELSASSDMESIVQSLPEIEPYLQFKEAKLSEDRKELILRYENIYFREWVEKLPKYLQESDPRYISPHFHSRSLNNALLLFLIKENLETVRYEIPEGYAEREQKQIIYPIIYSRSKLNQSLGNLNEARENPDYYHTVLEYNNAVGFGFLNNSFIGAAIGKNEKWLHAKTKNPDEKITEPGEEEPSIYRYYWEDRESYTDFRFSSHAESEDRIILEVSVHQSKDYREEDYFQESCLLLPESENLKKEYMRNYYGTPKMSDGNTDYYRINTGLSDYLYFTYNEKGEVIKYGAIRKSVRTIP